MTTVVDIRDVGSRSGRRRRLGTGGRGSVPIPVENVTEKAFSKGDARLPHRPLADGPRAPAASLWRVLASGGDGHVRFALVENEQRITQATRSIRKLLQG